MPTDENRPVQLELHDAVMESVSVRDRTAIIVFSHLCVYESTAEERYDVISYRATLTLEGVASLAITRGFGQGEPVLHGEVVNDEGQPLDASHLAGEEGCDVRSLALRFFGGGRLTVLCLRGRLFLNQRGQKTEEWIGPLRA